MEEHASVRQSCAIFSNTALWPEGKIEEANNVILEHTERIMQRVSSDDDGSGSENVTGCAKTQEPEGAAPGPPWGPGTSPQPTRTPFPAPHPGGAYQQALHVDGVAAAAAHTSERRLALPDWHF